MNLFRLAFLNATRNRTRSLLTAGIIVGGTALFIISMSWLDGVWDQILEEGTLQGGHIEVVTQEYRARASLRPQDENINDLAPVLDALRSQEGVVDAQPIIETGATLTVGEDIGDVFGAVMGAEEKYFTEYMDVDSKIVEGRWLKEGAGELVLGWKLAQRTGAKLGDEVILLGMTQDGSMSPSKGTLVGIARSGSPLVDRRVFVDLAAAQWSLDLEGGAMKVLVWGEDREDVDELQASIAALPPLIGLDTSSWKTLPPWGGQLGIMAAIRFVLMFMIAFLAGLGVWNTMMMSVLERTNEIGVLRAMGMTRPGAVFLFLFEGIAIAILGGIGGVVAGVLPTLYMSRHGFSYPESMLAKMEVPLPTTLYAQLSSEIVLLAFLTAIFTAVIGTFLPALRAATIQPDSAMRRN